ncbi:ATP-binding cassette domain-containing protein [Priestia aryabhattai]|uniref:ABC transporter ATP-binding protein n=1 Tax=Priestia aryabhattai TaxID=412384 RepID=UPI002E1F70EF|nr:ATP-binding cassette domain-containing protein [Priestia aryabhattai]MED4014139.1 ATP-binding cassette domain-containing protein [Priestia aryabhattai]
MKVIEVKNLSKEFHRYKMESGLWSSIRSLFKRKREVVKAISNINFDIKEGEIVGLIGANGAGKSTIIKMLVGLIPPSNGKIHILNHEPFRKKNDYLRNIAVVLGQKNQLWWDLTPYETFLLNKEIYNVSDVDFDKKVELLTEKLSVKHIMKTPVRNLSLGERMKCELISALLHSPKVLFLDEPTIGLDLTAQKNIREFLKEYCGKYRTTLILTSHYLKDIEELCERIIVLKNGSIYYDGSFDEFGKEGDYFKYLNLTFDKGIDHKEFEVYGEVVDSKENSISIKVLSDKASNIFQQIVTKYPVVDCNIEDMRTEELLTNIFTQQNIENNCMSRVAEK